MQALSSISGNMENNNQPHFSEAPGQWLANTYRQEFVGLKMIAVRMVHNEMEAEEIVGQCFAKFGRELCANPGKFSSSAHAKAYLVKSIRNECCSWLRKKRPVIVCEPPEAIMDDHQLVLELEKRDMLVHALSLIDRLPRKLRQVAMLYFKEGLTYEEIEKRLQVRKSVLHIYKSRAISKLREMVNKRKHDGKLSGRPVRDLL